MTTTHSEVDLPPQQVFSIQLGTEMFKLSGASLSSDAPSYFSRYFQCQIARAAEAAAAVATTTDSAPLLHPTATLYIDRDATTFRQIALHLQGYHVAPRTPTEYVRLWADALFYHLPRLQARLASAATPAVYAVVGGVDFVIPRALFRPGSGNERNFFTVGLNFAFVEHQALATAAGGDGGAGGAGGGFLQTSGLLFGEEHGSSSAETRHTGLKLTFDELTRPPCVPPTEAPTRSAARFAELLELLRSPNIADGKARPHGDADRFATELPIEIRSEAHRRALMDDASYYNFKGLEQRLVPCRREYDAVGGRWQIVIAPRDVRLSGLVLDESRNDKGAAECIDLYRDRADGAQTRDVLYQQPYIDTEPAELILQTATEAELVIGSDDRNEYTHLHVYRTQGPILTELRSINNALHQQLKTTSPVADRDFLKPDDIVFILDGLTVDISDGAGSTADTPSNRASPTDPIRRDVLPPARKRARLDSTSDDTASRLTAAQGREFPPQLIIRKALWKVGVYQDFVDGSPKIGVVLVAVRLEAYTTWTARNAGLKFVDG